jgi:hypothetical protein
MSRKIFGEFMEFSLKGLNPFKIQTNFKLNLLPQFLIQIMFYIWTSSKIEIYSFQIHLVACKVWKFLELRNYPFIFFKLVSIGKFGKS